MKVPKLLPAAVTAALLAVMMIAGSATPSHPPNAAPAAATAAEAAAKRVEPQEMRGVWISYMDLDMQNEPDKSADAFRAKFTAIAERCQRFGFNTLIVQVRPFCDALYPSKLFPASHILSGTQGKSAGYDALDIICQVCRAKDLRIHAWVNPYRVTANQTPAKLSADHPCVKDERMVLKTDSGMILDPSNEKARKLIVDGVQEIAAHYPVDGVQFDDYFYPPDIGEQDKAAYEAYRASIGTGTAMDTATWRVYNVNMLMAQTFLLLHRQHPEMVFGVSPQGNLVNNEKLSADVVHWCTVKGFVDYICPQIYFSPDNPALGFEDALNDWLSLDFADDVKLYVGLAGYKAGSDADGGTWQTQDDTLAQELRMLRSHPTIGGFMLYSYNSLLDPPAQAEMHRLQAAVNE